MKLLPVIDADYLIPKTVNFIRQQAAAKKPFFGSVWIQLPRGTPAGCVGAKCRAARAR